MSRLTKLTKITEENKNKKLNKLYPTHIYALNKARIIKKMCQQYKTFYLLLQKRKRIKKTLLKTKINGQGKLNFVLVQAIFGAENMRYAH